MIMMKPYMQICKNVYVLLTKATSGPSFELVVFWWLCFLNMTIEVSQDPDLDPVADHGVEAVLVPDVDLAPPVEQHVLLGLGVEHVERLDPGPEPELAHLQPPPPAPDLRQVQPDPPERGQEVRRDGEQDGVERNLENRVSNCNTIR